MLTLQSSKSWIVRLLIFKVKQDSLGDVILLTSQVVSFTEVQEGSFSRFDILSKIVLAGLQVLLSSANAAELSWACGRVFHHVF